MTAIAFQNTVSTGDLRIDALLGAQQWATTGSGPLELSYSFPETDSLWSNAAGDYATGDGWGPENNFVPLSEAERAAVRQALDAWAAVANIHFTETADNAAGAGTLRFGWTDAPSTALAFTYAPGSGAKAGDVWLNALAAWDGLEPGLHGYTTLLQEIGIALGMKHPSEGTRVLPPYEEAFTATVISSSAYAGAIGSWVDFEPTTPMPYDILAVQSMYGPNLDDRQGDDTYVFIEGQRYFETLWDGGGNDTIVWQAASQGAFIDLAAGSFSELGAPLNYWSQDYNRAWTEGLTVALDFGTSIENATGGNGSDLLIGNGLDNRLTPGLGDDIVHGGDGQDTVVLAMFPNVYALEAYEGGEVFGGYANFSYLLDLFDVESAEFGKTFQTTIPLSTLVSGQAQVQLGRLTDLYLAFFGRAPDVSGLEYWQEKLLEEGRDFATISREFAWSPEAQGLFPAAASNRAFVQTVYANCFGRPADQGGWDFWTAKLDKMGASGLNERGAFVGELILGAYASTSGTEDQTLLTNRHDAALYYVNQLSSAPQEEFDAGINALLARVSGDPSTLTKAGEVIDYAFAHPVTLTGVMTDAVLLEQLWGI